MAGRRKNTRRNTAEAHWEKYHAAKAAKGLTGAVSPTDHPDVIVHAYRARRASKAAKGQDTSSLDAAIKKANADNAPPGGWGEGDVLTRARTTSNRRKNTRRNTGKGPCPPSCPKHNHHLKKGQHAKFSNAYLYSFHEYSAKSGTKKSAAWQRTINAAKKRRFVVTVAYPNSYNVRDTATGKTLSLKDWMLSPASSKTKAKTNTRRNASGSATVDSAADVERLTGPLTVTHEGEENIYFTDGYGKKYMFKPGSDRRKRAFMQRMSSTRRKNTRQNASRLQSLGVLHDLRAQYGDGTKAYYRAAKQALLNKEISPGSLVGRGHKSPRRAALKYLDNKIQGATSNRRRNTRKANHHLKVGDRAEYIPIPGVFGTIAKAHAGDKYDIQWEQTGATQTNITGSKLKKAGKKNRRNTRRKNQRHGLFVI
jgi:hypothetical protein